MTRDVTRGNIDEKFKEHCDVEVKESLEKDIPLFKKIIEGLIGLGLSKDQMDMILELIPKMMLKNSENKLGETLLGKLGDD